MTQPRNLKRNAEDISKNALSDDVHDLGCEIEHAATRSNLAGENAKGNGASEQSKKRRVEEHTNEELCVHRHAELQLTCLKPLSGTCGSEKVDTDHERQTCRPTLEGIPMEILFEVRGPSG